MKQRFGNTASIIGFAAIMLGTISPIHAQSVGDPVPDTFTCTFVPGPVTATFEANRAASIAHGQLIGVYSGILSGFSIRLPAAAVQQMMARNPLISACHQSYYVGLPNGEAGTAAVPARGKPGGGGGGGGGGGSSQSTPWDVTHIGGPGSANGHKAWVLDTGIDPNTQDLNIDAALSRSFLSSDTLGGNTTDWYDFNGHGTHVAGTIAAINNSTGIVGVAPGAPVVSVRVLDSLGVAPDTDVLKGLQYIYQQYQNSVAVPGDVINISIEADKGSTVLDQAVASFAGNGIFVVMAAGNDGTNVDTARISPADQNGAGLYSVSATDQRDRLASFSNYGLSVDYAEPGVKVLSLAPGGGTATKDGTSMAAPHLAGILLTSGGTIGNGPTIKGDKDSQPDTLGVVP